MLTYLLNQGNEKQKTGIIGTQELTDNHRQMIELLAYALVLSGSHVYTSGGGNGTNIAVIRGALRACNPDINCYFTPIVVSTTSRNATITNESC